MSLPRVNAGHVAGQAVLIADQRRKNGFEVEEERCQEPLFTMRVRATEHVRHSIRRREHTACTSNNGS